MNRQKQKRINSAVVFFIAIVIIFEAASIIASITGLPFIKNANQNILFSQSLIFVPTIIYLIIAGKNVNVFDLISLKKTHPLMIILVPIIVLALEPVTAVINALSLLFAHNHIAALSNNIVSNNSFGIALLLMAALPAVVEETAFRGVVFGCFSEGRKLTAIIMSGVLFGIMHMNINQMAYGIVLGIALAFLLEATGSILSTMLAHFCINGISVALSYVMNKLPLFSSQTENAASELTKKELLKVISAYMPIAVIGFFVAGALILLLAVLNKRENIFLNIFKKQVNTDGAYDGHVKVMTPLLIITLLVCICWCVVREIIYSI